MYVDQDGHGINEHSYYIGSKCLFILGEEEKIHQVKKMIFESVGADGVSYFLHSL